MKPSKTTINDEICITHPVYTNYFISESGRIYKRNAWTKAEVIFLRTYPKVKYIKEIKCTVGITKGKEVLYAGIRTLSGKSTTIDVNRTVALLFIEVSQKRRNRSTVINSDGNIKNSHYRNLKYVYRKALNPHYKLNAKDISEIKMLIKQGNSLKQIADLYGVSDMQINRIKTGENWGNGKRVIVAPKAPFEISDGKLRRFIATFDRNEVSHNVRKKFYIKRDESDPTNNLIIGIINGYKLTKRHQNITRAYVLVDKLNKYFFDKKQATVTHSEIFV